MHIFQMFANTFGTILAREKDSDFGTKYKYSFRANE